MGDKKIDLQQVLHLARRYWYLFALILPLTFVAAWYVGETTLPKYQSNMLLLIKDKEESGQISEETIFAELGIAKKNKSLENELIILKSTPIMAEVVRNLDLQYQFTRLSGLKKRNLYKQSPITVVDWSPAESGSALEAELNFNGRGGYLLQMEEQTITGEFGKPLKLPAGKLTLAYDYTVDPSDRILIRILPVLDAALELTDALKVEVAAEESSVVELSLEYPSAQGCSDILAELADVYNNRTVADKTKVYANTIDLINERVKLLANELSSTERTVQSFKQSNNTLELSSEGSLLMNELSSYDKKLGGTDVQMEILGGIEDFLKKNEHTFEFIPTNLTLTNLTLNSQLESFNQLLSQRSAQRNELGPAHPDLKLTERQIQNLRRTIIENIGTIRKDLEISRRSDIAALNNLQSRIQRLPEQERRLVEIERQKNLTESLYLYLLQKREESAISMAVTTAKGVVIEPAIAPMSPSKPRKAQIWLIALFLGLALPAGIILALDNLNDKIQTEEDIEQLTTVPIAGTIAQSRKKDHVVVRENSRSIAAEMFRLLRANLAYVAGGNTLKTMLVTSGVSGDGKSFIALNLGMAQALSGKKVLILELDLRKPKQELYAGIPTGKVGVVNFLVDPTIKLDQIIRKSELHPNLDLITAGPKPPNPGELILSPRLRELIDLLREYYDFILIDAPPAGLVADAFQMKDLAESTLFVVRAGYTRKGQLQLINDIAAKGKLPKPYIVLNGVRPDASGGYGKGYYGYGYGSSNGYFEEDTDKNGSNIHTLVGKIKAFTRLL